MQEMVWHFCRWNQENKCRWKEAYDEQGRCFQTLAAFHARRVLNYNCRLLPAHIIPIRASERVVQAEFWFKCFASRAPLMLGRCAAPALESRAAHGFGGSPGRRGAGPARSHCTSALPGCTHTQASGTRASSEASAWVWACVGRPDHAGQLFLYMVHILLLLYDIVIVCNIVIVCHCYCYFIQSFYCTHFLIVVSSIVVR